MITFKQKPFSISPEYRIMYRIGQITLVLGRASTRQTASILKLHYFSWAMRSSRNMSSALAVADKEVTDYDFVPIWSVEPSLNRALSFAQAESIVCLLKGRVGLADKGKLLLEYIESDDELYAIEKQFLSKVKKKISDSLLQRLTKWWENQYAQI